ncbi:YopJ family acetyltransferase [Yersinia enterocolitica]
MFGKSKIKSTDSVSEAILRKVKNKDVTEKTLNKIAEKIISIKNATTPTTKIQRQLSRDRNPRTLSVYTENMNDVCNALQKIKNHAVYEKINKVIGAQSVGYALSHTKNLLNNNIQSNQVSGKFDTLTLTLMCESESNNINKKIIDFSCLDSLFRYIKESSDGNFKAITKMARMNDINEGHYTCIDVLKKGSKLDLVVYEPAYIQDFANAGPNYGVKCLRQLLNEQFNKGKMKPEDTRTGIIEMGIQRSPDDCAIFSVSIAKNLFKYNNVSDLMFSKLHLRGQKFNRFYEASAIKIIKDTRNIKQKIYFPPLFLKHSTSKSGFILTNAKDKIVNKKGQNLQQRVEMNYKSRDGLAYSNSIELKRDIYLRRLNGQKK